MKANSPSRKKSRYKGNAILEKLRGKTINKIARCCGYLQRKGGKISPANLVIGFLLMVSRGVNTYSGWAAEIGLLAGKSITRQALNERMTPQTEAFVKKMLEEQLAGKICHVRSEKLTGVLGKFGDVLIDDSTTVHLPDELAGEFPGNISRGKQKSLAKIHAQYNLTQNHFSFLHVHGFSSNDQSLSPHVLPFLKKGDLCLRDMGFSVLEVMAKFIAGEIYFISRKNYSTSIHEVETGIKIDLSKKLRRKKIFDQEVFIGEKKKLRVRLIAIPLPDAQTNERRRKAKADRDKRLNHSREYYELLGYAIYITNIASDSCTPAQIAQLYKLRWQIEIIFKSWKSCFSLEKLIHRQCKNAIRVSCIIYLMLLYIFLFHVVWWNHCERKIKNDSTKPQLSLLKIAAFFKQHFAELITINSEKLILRQIQTHCTYDKRKDRENARKYQLNLAI